MKTFFGSQKKVIEYKSLLKFGARSWSRLPCFSRSSLRGHDYKNTVQGKDLTSHEQIEIPASSLEGFRLVGPNFGLIENTYNAHRSTGDRLEPNYESKMQTSKTFWKPFCWDYFQRFVTTDSPRRVKPESN